MAQPPSQPSAFLDDRHSRLKLKPCHHEIGWNAKGESARRTRMRSIMPDAVASQPLSCLSPDDLVIDAATIMLCKIIGATAITQEKALIST